MSLNNNQTQGAVLDSEILPVWSLLSQLFITLIMFAAASLVPKHSPSYQSINEFLCSAVWVVCGLEGAGLAYTYSPRLSLFILFVRLILCPYVLNGACVNPAGVLHTQLQEEKHGRKLIDELLSTVAMEVLGMLCGVYYYYFVWTALGVTLSSDHSAILEHELDYFLQVSPLYGFFLELLMTFICYLPSLFMRRRLVCIIIEAVLILYLIVSFGSSTGAFMNPIAALSYLLMWHTSELSVSGYLTHFAVFWLGPCAGALLAVAVRKIMTRRNHEHML